MPQGVKELVLRGRGPNTMTVESLEALREELESAPDCPVLIHGQGGVFSAGLDIDALIDSDPREVTAAIERAAEALFLHPAPTVAAVNGHAIAGGCLLVQACDLRICTADPSIRIGMPGVALGISYPPKLMRVLRYRIPPHSIDRVLLEAANHDPEQALQLGLLDGLAPDALAEARRRILGLAAHPLPAYAEAKRALRQDVMEIPAQERRRYEAQFNRHWTADSLRSNRRDRRG